MKRTSLFCALLTLAGAARAEAPEPPDDATLALFEHDRHHQHGGITQFVELALDTLGEEPAKQAKVDQLQDQIHDCLEPVEQQEQALLLQIADGVAAGKVDAKAGDDKVAQLAGSASGIHGCVGGPLNALHATLSAPERIELGNKVRAHWAVWKHLNIDQPLDSRDADSSIALMTKELSLQPAQAEKIAAALKGSRVTKIDKAVVDGQIDAFAKAFAGTTFDATAVTTQSTASLSAQGAARQFAFYEAVVPLLTPEQRTTLAGHIREHAGHHEKVTVNQ
ncbi:MAG: hypothetical protein QM723_13950 [Myxococcaceae bacterium]